MSWKLSDIERLQSSGKIRGYQVIGGGKERAKSLPKIPPVEPVGLAFIKRLLTEHGIAFATEYKFCDSRKFRFDIAVVEQLTGVEYEGIFSKKSRHTTHEGYSKDSEKYNIATSLGWKVFRYTANTYKNFEQDITILKQTK